MADIKYHTIDPLILQTLNLNERRMNHILDILHGKPPRQYPQTERKKINNSTIHHPKEYQSQGKNQESLPPILLNRKKKTEKQQHGEEVQTYRFLKSNKSKEKLLTKQSQSLGKVVSKQEIFDEPNSNQKNIFNTKKKSNSKRLSTFDELNFEEDRVKLQKQKKQQLLNDYMMDKLKRSKSQQINPKDIYRLEIEGLVAELTPIEEIIQAQKRMQRLKRRNKHLHTFDKNYYSKLNQHDLVVLS